MFTYFEVLTRHIIRGGTDENHEKSQSGYSVSQPRFEKAISIIHIRIELGQLSLLEKASTVMKPEAHSESHYTTSVCMHSGQNKRCCS